MKSTRILIGMTLIGLCVLCQVNYCIGNVRSPGKVKGVPVYDRWDGCEFIMGGYFDHISEDKKEGLRDHTLSFIEIDATDVFQPKNPGSALIRSYKYLGPATAGKRGSIQRPTPRIFVSKVNERQNKPQVSIVLVNDGKVSMNAFSFLIKPVLLKNITSKEDAFKSLNPSDGPSFGLIVNSTFWDVGSEKPRWQGSGVQTGTPFSWNIGKENALPRVIILKPGESREIIMNFELPEGEYDFFCVYGKSVSNFSAFDVDHQGKPKVVNIKGRK